MIKNYCILVFSLSCLFLGIYLNEKNESNNVDEFKFIDKKHCIDEFCVDGIKIDSKNVTLKLAEDDVSIYKEEYIRIDLVYENEMSEYFIVKYSNNVNDLVISLENVNEEYGNIIDYQISIPFPSDIEEYVF